MKTNCVLGLDRCLLTDAEMARGPNGWKRLADPLPPWEMGAEDAEQIESQRAS